MGIQWPPNGYTMSTATNHRQERINDVLAQQPMTNAEHMPHFFLTTPHMAAIQPTDVDK